MKPATPKQQHVPASFIGEAVAQRPHVVAYRDPFRAADDANVLDGQDGEEEVLVGPVVPILVHSSGLRTTSLPRMGRLSEWVRRDVLKIAKVC
jgi:hypothetical protein